MEKKPEKMAQLFDAIAHRYDTGNALLSFGLHTYWNKRLIRCAPDITPIAHLDLCCGTGAIAAAYLRSQRTQHYTGYLLDISKEMLGKAEQRLKDYPNISYLHTDAHHLPLPDSSVDFVTLAYGIRNIQNPDQCLNEVFRVLKKGGTFAILELTRPSNPLLRYGHSFHLKCVLPFIGRWLTGNKEAYFYLQKSIHQFMDSAQLIEKLTLAHFTQVVSKPLTGGIATLYRATK